jgi:hypothetical protein
MTGPFEGLIKLKPGATDEFLPCLAELADAQQIVGYDDPAAIYFAQPEWITTLRRDVEGFIANRVVSGIIDYYALRRTPSDSAAVSG